MLLDDEDYAGLWVAANYKGEIVTSGTTRMDVKKWTTENLEEIPVIYFSQGPKTLIRSMMQSLIFRPKEPGTEDSYVLALRLYVKASKLAEETQALGEL